MALTDEQRAAMRANNEKRFREMVTRHYAYPPETWTVSKVADRSWRIVAPDGQDVAGDRFTTRKAAMEAIEPDNRYSHPMKHWRDNSAWYEGRADSRYRKLEPWEQAIVAEVVSAVMA